jgi:hypothetical protein
MRFSDIGLVVLNSLRFRCDGCPELFVVVVCVSGYHMCYFPQSPPFWNRSLRAIQVYKEKVSETKRSQEVMISWSKRSTPGQRV